MSKITSSKTPLRSVNSSDRDSFDSDNATSSSSVFSSSTRAVVASSAGSTRSRISSLRSYDSTDSSTSSTISCGDLVASKSHYRILMMGPSKVGKTNIIHQFLYDKFDHEHCETMDDMFRGEFDWSGKTISFDIHDTSGNYAYEFPAMFEVCLVKADAYVIVFALDDPRSWDQVSKLRDMIYNAKRKTDDYSGGDMEERKIPIVVVGNKADLDVSEDIIRECVEATVTFDWENGYVEASAKEGRNVNKIFRELLQQAKYRYDFSVGIPNLGKNSTSSSKDDLPHCKKKGSSGKTVEQSWKRRQSLPAAPVATRKLSSGSRGSQNLKMQLSLDPKIEKQESPKPRRSSLAILRRDSCNLS